MPACHQIVRDIADAAPLDVNVVSTKRVRVRETGVVDEAK